VREDPNPWVDPVATVLLVSRDGADLSVSLDLDRPYSPPLFPASLLRAGGDEALRLDRVEEVEPLRYEGRAFDAGHSSVAAGDRFIFRGWWTPDALDLVLDTNRSWVLERYPDHGGHEHCQLTWVEISAQGGEPAGYRSGDDWISVEAFRRYIQDDHLRVRSG